MKEQLRSLAAQVRAYQSERGWSDTKLCKEIASVGSSKTYKRILDPSDDLEELNVENQLRNYQSAIEIIGALRKKDRPAEPEYEDFTNVEESEAAVRRAIQEDEECVARLVIIVGPTATGKDAVKRHLLRKFPNNTVAVEANDLWKSSPTTSHLALYKALEIVKQGQGDAKTPRVPSELLAGIIEKLKSRKLILIINEGHHMGLPGLNMVKTIINTTPTVVVLICIPSLLTRLLGNNYDEAIQLTGNRLAERVTLPTPPSSAPPRRHAGWYLTRLQAPARSSASISAMRTKSAAPKTKAAASTRSKKRPSGASFTPCATAAWPDAKAVFKHNQVNHKKNATDNKYWIRLHAGQKRDRGPGCAESFDWRRESKFAPHPQRRHVYRSVLAGPRG